MCLMYMYVYLCTCGTCHNAVYRTAITFRSQISTMGILGTERKVDHGLTARTFNVKPSDWPLLFSSVVPRCLVS